MILESLNKDQLLQYLQSEEYRTAENIAISKHRAISHIQNPRALRDDILLIRAMIDGTMAGYLGILPDDITTDEGITVHCGWMSCLWVSPAHRGKKIAQKLVAKCFECWNNQVLLTEFTDAAGQLYYKSQLFGDPVDREGIRWYFSLNLSYALPPKHDFFNNIKGGLKKIDDIGDLFVRLLNSFRTRKEYSYDFTVTERISEDMKEFIIQNNTREMFRRGPEELQWTLCHPWILTDDETRKDALRYEFSSWSQTFTQRVLCIRQKSSDEISGLIFYTIRDGHLRLPYVYAGEDKNVLTEGISYIRNQNNIRMMTCFHQEIISSIRLGFYLFKKRQKRSYLFSRSLCLQTLPVAEHIQDGDGDCAFT